MCGVIKVDAEVHDFQESLKRSHEAEDLQIWEEVYRRAFPAYTGMVSYRRDGFWQREGIDRGVLLSNTKQLFVDEKVRGRNKKTKKVYDDILLEYISCDSTGAPGWVCKPLRADYIAYLIAPLGICHLLPVIQLQNAWGKYGEKWKDEYFLIKAPNNGYNTLSVGVPPDVLYPAIGRELRIRFDPFEVDQAA